MRTKDLFKVDRSSRRINESIEKVFGKKINLENFSLDQLQDARNKLRTQLSQQRSTSGFNENIENDAYTKAQWMLDAINSEIAHREEFIVDDIGQDVNEYSNNEWKPRDVAWYKNSYNNWVEVEVTRVDPESKVAMVAGSGGYFKVPFDKLSRERPSQEHVGEAADIDEDALQKVFQWWDRYMDEVRAYGLPDYNKVMDLLRAGDIDEAVAELAYAYTDQDGGEIPRMEVYMDDLQGEIEHVMGVGESYSSVSENQNKDNEMKKLHESEIDQASAIVTANTMVDRLGRWIEELSGMENETLLQLGDSIRDEMGQEQSRQFIETVAPTIQSALENLKAARESVSGAVRTLATGEQPADMLGAPDEPSMDAGMDMAEPDAMNADAVDIGPEEPTDDFDAAEPAAGGMETAGREKRESIEFQNRLLKVLAG